MTDQTAPAAATATAPSKSYGTSLSDPSGAMLRFTALVRKDGTVTTFGTYHDGKRDAEGKAINPSQRGATKQHPDMAAARKEIDKLTKGAIEKGWQAKKARAFRSKADSFAADSLPTAKKK